MSSLLIARVILLREVNGTVFRRGRLNIIIMLQLVAVDHSYLVDRVLVVRDSTLN